MSTNNPVEDLSHSLAHAIYAGFPEYESQERDFSIRDQVALITKLRKHQHQDIVVRAMFVQTWNSTALGFGGIGGQAFTDAYTIILESKHGKGFCVYFGDQFAYRVENPNPTFFEDIASKSMKSVKDHASYDLTKAAPALNSPQALAIEMNDEVSIQEDSKKAQASPSTHPDDQAVDAFAVAMKAKLAKKRGEGRSGWEDKSQCTNLHLSKLLHEHVAKGDPVDVGNFAMMLFSRNEPIC